MTLENAEAPDSSPLVPVPPPQIRDTSPPTNEQRPSRNAPWWHTTLLLLFIAAVSFNGSRHRLDHASSVHHLRIYSISIVMELVAACLATWGLWLRGTPLRQLLGASHAASKTWLADLGVGIKYWLLALLMMAAVSAIFDFTHHEITTRHGSHATGTSNPRDLDTASKTVRQLAPQNAPQMLLWIVLSLSAGVSEEILFRGYFQQQFTGITGRLWIGISCSAIVFGSAHAYEGIRGMVAIALFGAVLSVLAVKRGNLRSSMMVHAWHDVFTGGLLFLTRHTHQL